MKRFLCVIALAAAFAFARHAPAQTPAPLKTRNVILVMSDGLRWQEVFTGADDRLFNKANGVEHPDALRAEYWRGTPGERREALMPFVWGTVASHGQIYGNLFKGCDAHVTNPFHVSYPGYSETFCGFPNKAIKDNKQIENPEATVFEWLHARPGFGGRIAAFGAWDTFECIFNSRRCGFPVDCGRGPLPEGVSSEKIDLLNRLRTEVPSRWDDAPNDALIFHSAMEWLRLKKPRVMFLGLGETDEWAHEGEYAQYLHAAHRADAYLRELWETLQSMPEYRDSTSVIFTCDHGRGGDNRPGREGGELKKWRDHNAKVVGAEQIWITAIGPDTPPLGERAKIPAVTQSQIAATIAALLGEDYNAAEPRAATPITDILPPRE